MKLSDVGVMQDVPKSCDVLITRIGGTLKVVLVKNSETAKWRKGRARAKRRAK